MLKSIFCKIMSDEEQRQKMNSLENKNQIYKLFCQNGYTKSYDEFEKEMEVFLNSEDSKKLMNNDFGELSDDMLEMIAGGVNVKRAVTAGIATLLTTFTVGAIGSQILSQSNIDTASSPTQTVSTFDNSREDAKQTQDDNGKQLQDDNDGGSAEQTINKDLNNRTKNKTFRFGQRKGPNHGGPADQNIGSHSDSLANQDKKAQLDKDLFNRIETDEIKNNANALMNRLENFLDDQVLNDFDSVDLDDLSQQCNNLKDIINNASTEKIQNFLSNYGEAISDSIDREDVEGIGIIFNNLKVRDNANALMNQLKNFLDNQVLNDFDSVDLDDLSQQCNNLKDIINNASTEEIQNFLSNYGKAISDSIDRKDVGGIGTIFNNLKVRDNANDLMNQLEIFLDNQLYEGVDGSNDLLQQCDNLKYIINNASTEEIQNFLSNYGKAISDSIDKKDVGGIGIIFDKLGEADEVRDNANALMDQLENFLDNQLINDFDSVDLDDLSQQCNNLKDMINNASTEKIQDFLSNYGQAISDSIDKKDVEGIGTIFDDLDEAYEEDEVRDNAQDKQTQEQELLDELTTIFNKQEELDNQQKQKNKQQEHENKEEQQNKKVNEKNEQEKKDSQNFEKEFKQEQKQKENQKENNKNLNEQLEKIVKDTQSNKKNKDNKDVTKIKTVGENEDNKEKSSEIQQEKK